MLSAVALVAGIIGIPAIRGANAASTATIPTTLMSPSFTITSGPEKPPPAPNPAPRDPVA